MAGKIAIDTKEIAEICGEFNEMATAVDAAAKKLTEAKYSAKSFANLPGTSSGAFSGTQTAMKEVEAGIAGASKFLKAYAEALANAHKVHSGSDQAAKDDADTVKKDI